MTDAVDAAGVGQKLMPLAAELQAVPPIEGGQTAGGGEAHMTRDLQAVVSLPDSARVLALRSDASAKIRVPERWRGLGQFRLA